MERNDSGRVRCRMNMLHYPQRTLIMHLFVYYNIILYFLRAQVNLNINRKYVRR